MRKGRRNVRCSGLSDRELAESLADRRIVRSVEIKGAQDLEGLVALGLAELPEQILYPRAGGGRGHESADRRRPERFPQDLGRVARVGVEVERFLRFGDRPDGTPRLEVASRAKKVGLQDLSAVVARRVWRVGMKAGLEARPEKIRPE